MSKYTLAEIHKNPFDLVEEVPHISAFNDVHESPPIYNSSYYKIVTGISEDYFGKNDRTLYKIINNLTGVTEKETFTLMDAVATAIKFNNEIVIFLSSSPYADNLNLQGN